MTTEQQYKCKECGTECTLDQMKSDFTIPGCGEDEEWSNWICPKCEVWFELDDWIKIDTNV